MLAGCSSSTLLSPRHRVRSESSTSCHFQLPSSMSTQRLDLPPCTSTTFPRKEASARLQQQPIRPGGLPESTKSAAPATCSLKQNIRLPPLAVSGPHPIDNNVNSRSLKRFAEDDEGCCLNKRVKRKQNEEEQEEEEDSLSLGRLNERNFWFLTGLDVPHQIPPFSNNPWVETITELTDFGEKDGGGETSSHGQGKREFSGSITTTTSESQSLAEVGNGNGPGPGTGPRPVGVPYLHQGGEEEDKNHQGEERDFELVSLLTACVEAIGSKNIALINHFIEKLGGLASPTKGSPLTRLIAYYTEALALRVTRLWPHFFHITTPREFDRLENEDPGMPFRLLNQVTPIPKFIHFTSNEILVKTFEGKDRVHVIDFGIEQGLQWASFFQTLASRPNPPSHVRITGVGESKQELAETGERLAGFAQVLNLPFEFHPVVDRLEDVRLWMLHVKEQESIAINCSCQLHKVLYDLSGGGLRDFLGLIRSTNPMVVIVAEQEGEHNDPRLSVRVSNSLRYYSALFDSIDSLNLGPDSHVRVKIEEMFAREVRNIVACEGSDRVERHEGFAKWKGMLLELGGFKCKRVGDRELVQSQLLLKMYSCDSYNVKRQGGEEGNGGATEGITLSWEDQSLYTISAWEPTDDVTGGSG